ncbi:hypothetical protein GCM10012319_14600 [Comamonas sp. KCTC 72670]|nr:hypothetical protein GCM10012319_14600 [Comamonas sp. KCTC 72670]
MGRPILSGDRTPLSSPKAFVYMTASLNRFIAGADSGLERLPIVERAGKAHGFETFNEGSI